MGLSENYLEVKEKIALSAARTGRSADDITLVAVSKKVSADRMMELFGLGHRVFGENRMDEVLEKKPLFPEGMELHMIGHLQSRKAKDAVGLFDIIQSVDSFKLVKEIDKRSFSAGIKQEILLEVNTSGEKSKFGFAHDELTGCFNEILSFRNVMVSGLMAMAPLSENPEDLRPVFRRTKEYFEGLCAIFPMKYLSMGMSQDYEIAIQEGSNMVRIGTAIFK